MVQTLNNRYQLIHQSTNLIMLIEDDMDHAELIIRTTHEHVIPNQIIHFHDGQSALDYLFRRNEYCDPVGSPRPQLILLDVHLPGRDGIDILRTIKASDELRMIPVVMLTTSATEEDITSAYRNHANSYVIKAIGFEEFKRLMDILCSYWLGRNQRITYPNAN
jgi:CheY-like chemotaxis protein